ncbi:hypothetical protein BGZ76_002390 [Entomortierella beljakovae]|nr:hypothetical protein BGZ76_002390 [Entomortierella beljakovae]
MTSRNGLEQNSAGEQTSTLKNPADTEDDVLQLAYRAATATPAMLSRPLRQNQNQNQNQNNQNIQNIQNNNNISTDGKVGGSCRSEVKDRDNDNDKDKDKHKDDIKVDDSINSINIESTQLNTAEPRHVQIRSSSYRPEGQEDDDAGYEQFFSNT